MRTDICIAFGLVDQYRLYVVRTQTVARFDCQKFPFGRIVDIETSEKRTEPYAAIIVDIDSSYRRMAQTTLGRRGVVFENNFFCVQHPEDKGR